MSDGLDKLTRASFQDYLNTDFVIQASGADGDLEDYAMTLVEVNQLGDTQRDMQALGRESFSLEFVNADTSKYIPQGTYTITHATLGELTLFVVPLGPHEDGMRYEVLFT